MKPEFKISLKEHEEACADSKNFYENNYVIENDINAEFAEEQIKYDAAIKAINDFNTYCRCEQLKEIKAVIHIRM